MGIRRSRVRSYANRDALDEDRIEGSTDDALRDVRFEEKAMNDIHDKIDRALAARKAVQRSKGMLPNLMHINDEVLRQMGIDPEEFPQLEGAPGWRVVQRKGDQ